MLKILLHFHLKNMLGSRNPVRLKIVYCLHYPNLIKDNIFIPLSKLFAIKNDKIQEWPHAGTVMCSNKGIVLKSTLKKSAVDKVMFKDLWVFCSSMSIAQDFNEWCWKSKAYKKGPVEHCALKIFLLWGGLFVIFCFLSKSQHHSWFMYMNFSTTLY